MLREEVRNKILEITRTAFSDYAEDDFYKLPPEDLEKKNLFNELGLDSLDSIILEIHLEREFGVSMDKELVGVSLGELTNYIFTRLS